LACHEAGRFLDYGNDPQDAATQEVLKGLREIYVRSYTFDKIPHISRPISTPMRAQLSRGLATRLVETHSRKSRADVDIYIINGQNQAIAICLIASERGNLRL